MLIIIDKLRDWEGDPSDVIDGPTVSTTVWGGWLLRCGAGSRSYLLPISPGRAMLAGPGVENSAAMGPRLL